MSNITPDRYRRRIKIGEFGESLTEQEHRNTVEIHHILAKYKATGLLEHTNQFQGQYLDMATAPDYQEAQNIIANAKSMFETLPSDIRLAFENNPANFLETMQNPEEREFIESLGLDTSHFDELTPDQPAAEPQTEQNQEQVPPTTPDQHPSANTENSENNATN